MIGRFYESASFMKLVNHNKVHQLYHYVPCSLTLVAYVGKLSWFYVQPNEKYKKRLLNKT